MTHRNDTTEDLRATVDHLSKHRRPDPGLQIDLIKTELMFRILDELHTLREYMTPVRGNQEEDGAVKVISSGAHDFWCNVGRSAADQCTCGAKEKEIVEKVLAEAAPRLGGIINAHKMNCSKLFSKFSSCTCGADMVIGDNPRPFPPA